ncbi:MAG: hypothetical protein PWP44_1052 [Thermacetogenium sp.]|nr:hypothetical protein [Thermacetogenium sp.]MDN5375276.1 hypothetical protein [Thermacetogenium sp.]
MSGAEIKSRLRLPARCALVAAVTGFLVWASVAGARQEIRIVVDGKEVRHHTLQRTVGAALGEAGIELGQWDRVVPGTAAAVKNGLTVTVERAFPVRLVADGRTQTLWTTRTSVRQLLERASLELGEHDRLNLPLQAVVSRSCEIRVRRIQEKTVRERYSIPAPVERRPDGSLLRGQQRLVREGTPGEGERLVKVVLEDGKVVSRQTLSERVVWPPVSRVLAYGTLNTVSRGGQILRFRKALEVRATAYSAAAGSRTATGHPVGRGVVAVDPQVIPLGSRLFVEGYGYGTALDKGSAIRGNRIDVFFPTEAECRRWGVRYVKVYVLE